MRLLEKTEPSIIQPRPRAAALGRSAARPTHAARQRVAAWRDWLDRGLALALLVPGLPLMALTILAVRLTSRGPGIYRQARVGLRGKVFIMRKIRTMRCDAESATGPVWARQHDPRVTSIGRVIRALHLDELPQLFNVMRGEMALVGPRPERPEFTQWLKREIPGYENRLAALPGITGLAQINLPPDTDLDSVRRKLALDLEYIHTRSLWLDARIVACTALRMLNVRGPVARRWLLVHRAPVILIPESREATAAALVIEPVAANHVAANHVADRHVTDHDDAGASCLSVEVAPPALARSPVAVS